MTERLSHVGPDGDARMVDVSAKPVTARAARASGSIRMEPATLAAIQAQSLKKGDVLGVARVAGIMAAKRTADLIPLCHPLPLDDVQVSLTPDPSLPGIRAEATARTTGRTGVEMEAIVAVSISLVTVYDMAKAIDRTMTIGEVALQEKTGGQTGDWSRG
ncbi:MAG: cyclic pyranopterin monophosphate synthase MoaC [Gemmatimonadetes bacterium 21-71-4]|nr:MAG: cyclic pyranopterin monophosphate synthase MoaC [Gemmatimonadetes bacterium 21-71-4]